MKEEILDLVNAQQDFFKDTDWVSLCSNEYELLTALILDTQTPLERLYKVIKGLKNVGLLDFRDLHKFPQSDVARVLKNLGYPWNNTKSKYITQQPIPERLMERTYEEMMEIQGIGPKLASLWMQMVHGAELPVIDTHVKRFLAKLGYPSNHSYDVLAEYFKAEAKMRNMTVKDLDRQVVRAGILKRRGLS